MSKNALIITDGTKTIQSIAGLISGELKGFKVKTCIAENFRGTDMLPSDIFFFGCENADPESFSYLTEMLSHISLASRKCGVFTLKEKTLKYLLKIVKDCEADVRELPLSGKTEVKASEIKKWVKYFIVD